jgi:hypothetical protein
LVDGFADIFGIQPAGEEDKHRGLLDDPAAQAPIVDAAGAAKLFNCQSGIVGVY